MPPKLIESRTRWLLRHFPPPGISSPTFTLPTGTTTAMFPCLRQSARLHIKATFQRWCEEAAGTSDANRDPERVLTSAFCHRPKVAEPW